MTTTHDLQTHQLDISLLRPHPSNPRNGDTDAIAESLATNGQYRPIVCTADGTILAGNHTYAAALSLGWSHIAAVRLDIAPDSPEAVRIMLADNRTADLGEYDDALLLDLVRLLNDEAGLEGSGWTEDTMDELAESLAPTVDSEAWEKYTRTVNVPQYEPTQEKPPPIRELTDQEKYRALCVNIEEAHLPSDVAAFLTTAAARHIVFDYRRIAEFYAHADPQVQALMEQSALVIIDPDDAIRNGYLILSDWLDQQQDAEAGGEAGEGEL